MLTDATARSAASAMLVGAVLVACGGRSQLELEQGRSGAAGAASRGGSAGTASVAPACDFELLPESSFEAGSAPQSLAAGDLDGDGDVDLVVGNRSGYVSLLYNLGRRELSAPVTRAVENPTALAVADLDADGRPELIVGNGDLCTLTILASGADGRFPPASHPTGCRPQAIVAADFDGDGRPDLATANNTSATLSVLVNRGERRFDARVAYDFGSRPTSLATADLDGDGRLDLVATSWGYSPMKSSAPIVGVFHNAGAGRFELARRFDVGGAPRVVTTGDFDADGAVDLALGHEFESGVTIYRSLGKDGYDMPLRYPTGVSPVALAAADFDDDGRLDLVTADQDNDGLSFLRGAERGTFAARYEYPTSPFPQSLVVGDFDADGISDVAVTAFRSGTVGLFFGVCR